MEFTAVVRTRDDKSLRWACDNGVEGGRYKKDLIDATWRPIIPRVFTPLMRDMVPSNATDKNSGEVM